MPTTRAQAARAAEAAQAAPEPTTPISSRDMTSQCPPAPVRQRTQGLTFQHAEGVPGGRTSIAFAVSVDESIGLGPSIIWSPNHSEE